MKRKHVWAIRSLRTHKFITVVPQIVLCLYYALLIPCYGALDPSFLVSSLKWWRDCFHYSEQIDIFRLVQCSCIFLLIVERLHSLNFTCVRISRRELSTTSSVNCFFLSRLKCSTAMSEKHFVWNILSIGSLKHYFFFYYLKYFWFTNYYCGSYFFLKLLY